MAAVIVAGAVLRMAPGPGRTSSIVVWCTVPHPSSNRPQASTIRLRQAAEAGVDAVGSRKMVSRMAQASEARITARCLRLRASMLEAGVVDVVDAGAAKVEAGVSSEAAVVVVVDVVEAEEQARHLLA